MEERYVKEEKKIISRGDKEFNAILIQSIINTYNNIEIARKNYEFAEGEMIDYYLYEIKANQSKLNYLIKKCKVNGVELSRIEKLQFLELIENEVV